MLLADSFVLDACAVVLCWCTPLHGAPRAGEAMAEVSRSVASWPQSMTDDCCQSAAETLFQLSLSAAGKQAVLAHEHCMRAIRHHAEAAQSPASTQCCGALRSLEGVPRGCADDAGAAGKHLMVSYQWDVQDAVVRIVGSLKQRGFAVWFDMVRSCSLPRRVLVFWTCPASSHSVVRAEDEEEQSAWCDLLPSTGSNERQHAGRHGGGGGGCLVRADVHVGQLQGQRQLPAGRKL